MIVSGDVMEELLQRAVATQLKCRKCGTAFTFEQGGRQAIDAGESGKVMCPCCGVVYEADVHPNGIELRLDGHRQWFETLDAPAKRDWRFWKK